MIEILKSGLHTSIQDRGRYGSRKFGVPLSGAMDSASARFANAILGNDPSEAVLEITLVGPEILFHSSCVIALAGAPFVAELDGTPVSMHKAVFVAKNQRLNIKNCREGVRAYLAVRGGWKVEHVLGSASQFAGITSQSSLLKGDVVSLKLLDQQAIDASTALIKPTELDFTDTRLVASAGPEFQLLSEEMQALLLQTTFTISAESNRMGARLEGIQGLHAAEIITAPVQPGTVQLTPSGKLIVLMRDAPTTGGYARVLQLSNAAIDRLAQRRAGQFVQFVISA